MAKSLIIPNGSPVRWIYNVLPLSGSIREDDIIRNNDPWPGGTMQCGTYYPDYCQPFDCDDTTVIQIIHENTDDPYIILEIRSSVDDSILAAYPFTIINGLYKNGSVDFADVDCGECVYLQLTTVDCKGSIWACGTSGTFEGALGTWGVSSGLTNTIAASGIARTGTQSANIQTSAIPGPSSDQLIYCTSDFSSIGQNSYFCLTGYVYDLGGFPAIQDFENVGWELSTGFSDATVVYDVRPIPSEDGRNTWLEFTMIFKTGLDDSGSIRAVTSAIPQATGFVYFDDFTLKTTDQIQEAYSESLCVEDLDKACFPRVRYFSDVPSHNFYYDGTWENFLRVPLKQISQRFEDPDFERFTTSNGTNLTLSSKLLMVYSADTQYIPAWFHEKIAIFLKHEHFFLNDVEFKALDAAYVPDFPTDYAMGTAEVSIIDSEYDEDYTFS